MRSTLFFNSMLVIREIFRKELVVERPTWMNCSQKFVLFFGCKVPSRDRKELFMYGFVSIALAHQMRK